MARTVIWQDRAVRQFESIQDYLRDEWGVLVNVQFTQKVFNHLEIIRRYPEIGLLEFENKGICGFTITKQTQVLYQFDQDHIYLLAFFDTRQDPSKKLKDWP